MVKNVQDLRHMPVSYRDIWEMYLRLSDRWLFSPWETEWFCAHRPKNYHTFEVLNVENASHPWGFTVLSLVDVHRAPRLLSPVAGMLLQVLDAAGVSQE